MIFQNITIDQILDFANFRVGQRLVMRKIKPQIIRRDDRTGLLDVRSENFLERRVNKMRRRMISSGRVAFFNVNRRRYRISDFYRAFFDFRFMQNQTLHGRE